MAAKKKCFLDLLDELEQLKIQMRLKIQRAERIPNDPEAVRRILRELKDML